MRLPSLREIPSENASHTPHRPFVEIARHTGTARLTVLSSQVIVKNRSLHRGAPRFRGAAQAGCAFAQRGRGGSRPHRPACAALKIPTRGSACISNNRRLFLHHAARNGSTRKQKRASPPCSYVCRQRRLEDERLGCGKPLALDACNCPIRRRLRSA